MASASSILNGTDTTAVIHHLWVREIGEAEHEAHTVLRRQSASEPRIRSTRSGVSRSASAAPSGAPMPMSPTSSIPNASEISWKSRTSWLSGGMASTSSSLRTSMAPTAHHQRREHREQHEAETNDGMRGVSMGSFSPRGGAVLSPTRE